MVYREFVSLLSIWRFKEPPEFPKSLQSINAGLEIKKQKCVPGNSAGALFGMFKWPFQRLSDLQLGDQKVTLNQLVVVFQHAWNHFRWSKKTEKSQEVDCSLAKAQQRFASSLGNLDLTVSNWK